MSVSDAGADVRTARAKIHEDLAPFEHRMLFDIDCLAHQYQIISLSTVMTQRANSFLVVLLGNLQFLVVTAPQRLG